MTCQDEVAIISSKHQFVIYVAPTYLQHLLLTSQTLKQAYKAINSLLLSAFGVVDIDTADHSGRAA